MATEFFVPPLDKLIHGPTKLCQNLLTHTQCYIADGVFRSDLAEA